MAIKGNNFNETEETAKEETIKNKYKETEEEKLYAENQDTEVIYTKNLEKSLKILEKSENKVTVIKIVHNKKRNSAELPNGNILIKSLSIKKTENNLS
jgi:hypothetical protein